MRLTAQIASALAAVTTLLAPCLYFAGQLGPGQMKQWMLAAAVVWFVATPLWMERGKN
jgi:hypothetical protein